MYDDAQEIFDYLPIRANQVEQEYIDHLWSAFTLLSEASHSFAIMPFHLLFMLSLQYKALRIAKHHVKASTLFFHGVGGRKKQEIICDNPSVFSLSLIHESTLPEIFQLIESKRATIQNIKDIVKSRNKTFAHASGVVQPNLESDIDEYILSLSEIQKCCVDLNDAVSEKIAEQVESSEEAIKNTIEMFLGPEHLTNEDFRQGGLIAFYKELHKII